MVLCRLIDIVVSISLQTSARLACKFKVFIDVFQSTPIGIQNFDILSPMNRDICFVAFNNTIASKALSHLSQFQTYTIESDFSSLADFVKTSNALDAKYIIGLGQYSGRDKDMLRIETRCNKNFRNNEIEKTEHLQLDDILLPANKSKLAFSLGNSWCNLFSVMMLNNPDRNYLYAFIHIPKNFKDIDVTEEILKMLPYNPAVE